mmetsp:Transcript_17229/g.43296  ORF Transcript_17229/g.43296 Transcript_17229/m.43296 type:complete len:247 (+) Transcript_17229:15-755(+)
MLNGGRRDVEFPPLPTPSDAGSHDSRGDESIHRDSLHHAALFSGGRRLDAAFSATVRTDDRFAAGSEYDDLEGCSFNAHRTEHICGGSSFVSGPSCIRHDRPASGDGPLPRLCGDTNQEMGESDRARDCFQPSDEGGRLHLSISVDSDARGATCGGNADPAGAEIIVGLTDNLGVGIPLYALRAPHAASTHPPLGAGCMQTVRQKARHVSQQGPSISSLGGQADIEGTSSRAVKAEALPSNLQLPG